MGVFSDLSNRSTWAVLIMQIISVRISRLAITISATPEVATQWLYNEFVREADNLPTGKDAQDAFPSVGKGRRW